jgi:hypothetical protein
VNIDFSIIGVNEAVEGFEGGYYRMFAAALREMQVQMVNLRNYAVQNTMHGQMINQRTGNLARNVASEAMAEGESVIGRVGVPEANTAPYARILHDGGTTRAHVIEARNAQTLAFMAGGHMIYRRRVNHPGSKFPARPYLAAARDAQLAEIRAGLIRAMERARAA